MCMCFLFGTGNRPSVMDDVGFTIAFYDLADHAEARTGQQEAAPALDCQRTWPDQERCHQYAERRPQHQQPYRTTTESMRSFCRNMHIGQNQ